MCHVLIIEDDWIIAEHLSSVVREAGATKITQAATQDEALAAALNRPPDVIVSDVKLAAGLGPLAVQSIIAELGEVPVIFITATPDECKPCAPPGVVLEKPINDEHVRNAFRRFAFPLQ